MTSIVRLTSGAQWFFFMIILFSNFMFLGYWLYKMLKEMENMLRSKFEKAYLYC